MNVTTIRKIPLLLIISGLLILTLCITTSWLYRNNESYRQRNRELIIQNDSILSINIELTEALNAYRRIGWEKADEVTQNEP